MMVSSQPHHLFNPPGKYWDMYSPDDFSLSRSFSSQRLDTAIAWYLGDGARTRAH